MTSPPIPGGKPQMNQIKTILLGMGGVGKTAFVTRHQTGEFVREYNPTFGQNIATIPLFGKEEEQARFELWDTAGQELFVPPLRDVQCAIVMYDVTNRPSARSVDGFIATIEQVYGEIPILVLGNKVDVPCKRILVRIPNKPNIKYMDFSVKSCYNLQESLEWLAQRVL